MQREETSPASGAQRRRPSKPQIKSINLTTDDSETPTLRISTVGNTIYSLLGVLDYANLRFNGQTANVEAGKEEVFVLGEVTVSETNPVS